MNLVLNMFESDQSGFFSCSEAGSNSLSLASVDLLLPPAFITATT